jgi:hypothetical protein
VVNDTLGHLEGIAALASKKPKLEMVELLAYHNLGNDKYTRYGMVNPLPGIPSAEEGTQQKWVETLRERGCSKVVLG